MPYAEIDLSTAILDNATYSGGAIVPTGASFFTFIFPDLEMEPGKKYRFQFDWVHVGAANTTPSLYSIEPGDEIAQSISDWWTLYTAPGSLFVGASGTRTFNVGPGIQQYDLAMADVPPETKFIFEMAQVNVTGVRWAEVQMAQEWSDYIQPDDTRVALYRVGTGANTGEGGVQILGGLINSDGTVVNTVTRDQPLNTTRSQRWWSSEADGDAAGGATFAATRAASLAGSSGGGGVSVSSAEVGLASPAYVASTTDPVSNLFDVDNSTIVSSTPAFVKPEDSIPEDGVDALGGIGWEWHPDDVEDTDGVSTDHGEVLSSWVSLVWKQNASFPSSDTHGASFSLTYPDDTYVNDDTTFAAGGMPSGPEGDPEVSGWTIPNTYATEGAYDQIVLSFVGDGDRSGHARITGTVGGVIDGGNLIFSWGLNAITDLPGSWAAPASGIASVGYDLPLGFYLALDMNWRPPRYRVLLDEYEVLVPPGVVITATPILRVYPRTDGRGASSAPRLWPLSRSRQGSNRVGGNTYI